MKVPTKLLPLLYTVERYNLYGELIDFFAKMENLIVAYHQLFVSATS